MGQQAKKKTDTNSQRGTAMHDAQANQYNVVKIKHVSWSDSTKYFFSSERDAVGFAQAIRVPGVAWPSNENGQWVVEV